MPEDLPRCQQPWPMRISTTPHQGDNKSLTSDSQTGIAQGWNSVVVRCDLEGNRGDRAGNRKSTDFHHGISTAARWSQVDINRTFGLRVLQARLPAHAVVLPERRGRFPSCQLAADAARPRVLKMPGGWFILSACKFSAQCRRPQLSFRNDCSEIFRRRVGLPAATIPHLLVASHLGSRYREFLVSNIDGMSSAARLACSGRSNTWRCGTLCRSGGCWSAQRMQAGDPSSRSLRGQFFPKCGYRWVEGTGLPHKDLE